MRINHYRFFAPETESSSGGSAVTDTKVDEPIAEGTTPHTETHIASAAAVKTGVGTHAASTVATHTEANKESDKKNDNPYWAEDWRQRLAGSNEKELQQLNRYASPEDIWKKARALEQRLSSGELKANLPKNAGPEELKAWRAENGIPESHDKYDLGKDFQIADTDKQFAEHILKNAHETHQTPEQVKASLRAFKEIQTTMTEQRNEQDRQAQAHAEEVLRSEWGGEFRRDINLIHGLLDRSGGKDLKNKFLNGRLADGTPIGSSPEALKMLLSLALVDNPAGVVVPNAGGDMADSVNDEIKKIEKMMRENRKAYDKDEDIQARYRDLIVAREQFKSRK